MSGVVSDYYASKAQSQQDFVAISLVLLSILTPIYLGYQIREELTLCRIRKNEPCDNKKIVYYSLAIIYLIIVIVMQFLKYKKDKDFQKLINEKKKTNDELKNIDDENKAFSKKTTIISIPFYIFLAVAAIYIIFGLFTSA